MRSKWAGVAILVVTMAFGGIAAKKRSGAAAPPSLPNVKELPATLPESKIKQDGNMGAVKATAAKLKASMTTMCKNCGGKGEILLRTTGAGLNRPESKKCPECEGKGHLKSEPKKVAAAALALVTGIVRMPADAEGATAALKDAYAALTETVLTEQKVYESVTKDSIAMLTAAKLEPEKMVIVRAIYSEEMKHPTRPGEKIYILRLAGKKEAIALVGPKQADPPRRGGNALIGGVIAGSIEANTGGKERETLLIIEHGFIISPNPGHSWWNWD